MAKKTKHAAPVTEDTLFEQFKAEARQKYGNEDDLKKLAKEYLVAREAKEKLEERLKRANAHFDVLRFEAMPNIMDKQGVDTIKYDGIGRLSMTPVLYVGVKGGAKLDLFAWFKKNKLADLIQPIINSSTLTAWVKERMQKGKKIPSELLNVTAVTRVSITKVGD